LSPSLYYFMSSSIVVKLVAVNSFRGLPIPDLHLPLFPLNPAFSVRKMNIQDYFPLYEFQLGMVKDWEKNNCNFSKYVS